MRRRRAGSDAASTHTGPDRLASDGATHVAAAGPPDAGPDAPAGVAPDDAAPGDVRPALLRRRVRGCQPVLPRDGLQHHGALRARGVPGLRRPRLRARLHDVLRALRADPLLSHAVRGRHRLLHGDRLSRHLGGTAVRPRGVQRLYRPGADVHRRRRLRGGLQRAVVLQPALHR
jgi:hypothetical protein